MLARIAHELFWLGRNLVRAEHTARMLDGVFQADLQGRPEDPAGVTLSWRSILAIMGGDSGAPGPIHRDEVLTSMTLDPDNPASVVACINRARHSARTVRDVISAETWEAINTTHLMLAGGTPELSALARSGPLAVHQYVKERSALTWGLTRRSMLRDEASAFLEAGGRIESADMVLRMLRVAIPTRDGSGDADVAQLDGQAVALLTAVGGFQAFRRAVPGQPNALPVARFLLFERAYPDSVAASVESTLTVLTRADASPRTSEPILRLSRLGADLEFQARTQPDDADLAVMCESVQEELKRVDSDIAERYFAGATPAGVVMSTA